MLRMRPRRALDQEDVCLLAGLEHTELGVDG
jgi:hypothetical protein